MDAKAADALAICLRLVPAMRATAATLERDLIEGGISRDIVLDERRQEGLPTNPTANKAVRLLSDPDLRLLRRRLEQIDQAYAALDPELAALCDLMFWSPMRDADLDDLGELVGYSERTLRRKRLAILLHFADRIEYGWERPSFWFGLSPVPEE